MKKYPLTVSGIKGFTLIELLITLLVLGIIVSVAAPGFTTLIASNNADNGARRLASAFAYARSEAVTRAANVRVCASSDGASCTGGDWSGGWLIYHDADADNVYDATSELLRVSDISALQSAVAVAPAVNTVCFNSLGEQCAANPNPVARSFTFQSGGASAALNLFLTGASSL